MKHLKIFSINIGQIWRGLSNWDQLKKLISFSAVLNSYLWDKNREVIYKFLQNPSRSLNKDPSNFESQEHFTLHFMNKFSLTKSSKKKTIKNVNYLFRSSEAVAQVCSAKKVFLNISQNSKENTCAWVSFLIKSQAETLAQVFACQFCEISGNTVSYRTPLVAAFDYYHYLDQLFFRSHFWAILGVFCLKMTNIFFIFQIHVYITKN